ncbi:uncharacterized protein JCM6883_003109 [Sporobolomyces salmoneus]|uniref:uncharacterized protein n=1 Tax=Sporobolomyces salmoneus TaxID=183962 RepID=UPI003176CB62
MDHGSKSSSRDRDSRDRDRDRVRERDRERTPRSSHHSHSHSHSSLPPSRNRLPPTASSSSSAIFSPPLRVSSLPNTASTSSSLSSLPLPLLPPTGPAAYRSREQHRSHSNSLPNSPLVSAGPPLRLGMTSTSNASNLPVRPQSVGSKRSSTTTTGGIRSRSPSIVSIPAERIATPSSSSASRLPNHPSRTSSLSTGGGTMMKKEEEMIGKGTTEERRKEELKRLERAERFGIPTNTTTSSSSNLPSTSSSTGVGVVGTSRSRLEGILQNVFFSPSSSSSSSSSKLVPALHSLPSTTTQSATTSTGFQIPYKNRISRSRKRSRQEQDQGHHDDDEDSFDGEERERRRYGSTSRNSSPGPTARERERDRERERERERGSSRWDRGSDRTGAGGGGGEKVQGGGKRFSASSETGGKSNYSTSLLRFPLDSTTTPSTVPSSRRSNHYSDSRSTHPHPQFVPIGNLSNLGVNGSLTLATSSKPNSRNVSESNTSTPRARSPVDWNAKGKGRERTAVDRGWNRERETSRDERRDQREGSRFAQPQSQRARSRSRSRSRSYSPGEIPEPLLSKSRSRPNSPPPPSQRIRTRRSRSRSRSESRTRSRSPERNSRNSISEAYDSRRRRRRTISDEDDGYSRRPKLEDEEDPAEEEVEEVPPPPQVSDTPPLPPPTRLPRPSSSASDTPPRDPPPLPTNTSNSTMPSRRRLPPSAMKESPQPLIPLLASIIPPNQFILADAPLASSSVPSPAQLQQEEEEEEELEEGEEKEEGEIVSTPTPNLPVPVPVPVPSSSSSRNRIPLTTYHREPSPVPPPPPRARAKTQTPISTTPPPPPRRQREAIAETRGETPPLPSPRRSRTISSTTTATEVPTLPVKETESLVVPEGGGGNETEKEREEGEIVSEADLIGPLEEVEKSERPDKVLSVEAEKEERVEPEKREQVEEKGSTRVEEMETTEKAEEERKEEEDLDMFETNVIQEEEVVVPSVQAPVESKSEQPEKGEEEVRDVNDMQVDEPIIEPEVPVQQPTEEEETPSIERKEEEPAIELEMDIDHSEPAPTLPVREPTPQAELPIEEPLVVERSTVIEEPVVPSPPRSVSSQRPVLAAEFLEPAHPSSTTPLDHHSPPQPISPPTKHISPGQNDLSIAHEEIKLDSAPAPAPAKEQAQSPVLSIPLAERETWFKATWDDFSTDQTLMIPFLIEEFSERDQRRGEKMVDLRKQYRIHDQDWQAHVKRLDKIKDRIQRKSIKNSSSSSSTAAPQTPSIDSSRMPYYPEPATPGPLALGGGRANRRGGGGLTNSTWGNGDAVRSEAEFLEILASLENADLRDPDVRAARTAAVVPDLAVDPSERAEIISCTFDDERYRIDDPVEAYGVSTPMEPWTEAEVETYCKGYAQHPKQFGKIAQNLPNKTTAQCVLFYYRMKNAIDFRSLSERRGRDGRRKKTKKRPGEGKGKGSSLLSNLKGAKSTMLGNRDDYEDEDEDDRPIPVSPRNTRPPLPSIETSTLTTSATPRPPPSVALDRLFEDDNDEYTPSAASKNARNARLPQLHSEGMIEAAEVLGALATIPNADDQDDAGSSSLRPRAAKTNRKVRMDLDDDGAIETTVSNEKLKPRRKANSSSYWSAAEKADILRLLEQHGKNWKAIGEEMGTKTAVQCRNWFTNNAKKLGLRNLVSGNSTQDYDDQDDDSPAVTPLVQSPAVSRPATSGPSPMSYFPTPDGRQLPPLPSFPQSAPTATSLASKAGMHLRNMLNEDTPDEEASNSAKEDWFGSSGGGPDEDPSEDESFTASAHSSRPVTANERAQSLQQQNNNRIILSNGLARPSAHLPGPSQLPSFPTSLPPNRRFDHFLPRQAATIPVANRWSPAPTSPFASYGSPATPGVSSSADHYRRPTPPEYFQAKTVYDSHPQLQPHQHSQRFSAVPVALQPSPPIPSASTFTPATALPSSAAMYQNGWTPDPRR